MLETRVLTYDADGVRMLGYLARNDARSGPRPAVLIAPEAPGLDDYNRERCRRMAELGFIAFALDFHGDGFVFKDRDSMAASLLPLMAAPLRIRARGSGARRFEISGRRGCVAHRGDRLLFWRHDRLGTRARRRRDPGGGRISLGFEHDASAGCEKHQSQDSGLQWRGRSHRAGGAASGIRTGDDGWKSGLAALPVWRRWPRVYPARQ
jgi:hypothetical protein